MSSKGILTAAIIGLSTPMPSLADQAKKMIIQSQGYSCNVAASGDMTRSRIQEIIDKKDLKNGTFQDGIGGLPGGDRFLAIAGSTGGFGAKCVKDEE